MIISQAKDCREIEAALEGSEHLFLIGCAACATVCKSGGEEQVFQMQEWLVGLGKTVTGSVVIDEACHLLRTSRDLRYHRLSVGEADALVVMTCGAGVQAVSSASDKRVVAALDTVFLGNIRRSGQYEERCSLCGECILNETAGICPVTTCAKGLLNGPCGGMEDGRCEADRELDCAWHLIYERLKKQGRKGVFARTVPPKNWGKVRKPGRLRLD